MAGPAGPAQAATERLALFPRPLRGRGTVALAGLAAALALCLAALGAVPRASERPPAADVPWAQAPATQSARQAGVVAALSRTMGARDPGYHARATGDGYAAGNPAQHLRVRFGDAGVALAAGSLRVSLSPRASGDGAAKRWATGAAPQASANRVSYAHPSLTEWYENGKKSSEKDFDQGKETGMALWDEKGKLLKASGTAAAAKDQN